MRGVFNDLFFFVVALAALIAVHEWGHFAAARLLGVKVLRFSIGFGRTLFRYVDRKGTEFVLSWMPLGGYVRMLDEENGDEVEEQARTVAFNRQPLWSRCVIVVAGPAVNVVFAVLLLWVMFTVGIQRIAPVVGEVLPNSMAQQAGLQAQDEIVSVAGQPTRSWYALQMAVVGHVGSHTTLPLTVVSRSDHNHHPRQLMMPLQSWQLPKQHEDFLQSLGIRPYTPLLKAVIGEVKQDSPASGAGLQVGDVITAVNGQPIHYWYELLKAVMAHPRSTMVFAVQRGDEHRVVRLVTGQRQWQGRHIGVIGVVVKRQPMDANWLRLERYSLAEGLRMALSQSMELLRVSFVVISKLLTGQISYKSVSGPIDMAQGAGISAEVGFAHFLSFLALLSINLAVINLLPIPVLDGGHLLFYLIEAIRGRSLTLVLRQRMIMVGVLLLASLMGLSFYNDLERLFYRYFD